MGIYFLEGWSYPPLKQILETLPGLTETFPVKESYAIPSVRSFGTDRHTVSKSNILFLLCKNYIK